VYDIELQGGKTDGSNVNTMEYAKHPHCHQCSSNATDDNCSQTKNVSQMFHNS